MKPEVKKMWVDALRSGKYRQIEKFMSKRDRKGSGCGFCALGVLHDLFILDTRKATWLERPGGWYSFVLVGSEDGEDIDTIREAISDWAGTENTTFFSEIIRRNDHVGLTFPQIADWIEANL